MTRALTAALALAAIGLTACPPETDFGAACTMVKADSNGDGQPDGIPQESVSNAEIDYVSLGSAECDDLVCIRTAGGGEYPTNADNTATGYCTACCLDDSDCDSDFQGNSGMKCERLILDQDFLDKLCGTTTTPEDRKLCEDTFGANSCAKYCIRPRAQ